MARALAGFGVDRFKAGIRKAMLMSMPNDPARWPLFVIPQPLAGPVGAVDRDGVPWDVEAPREASTALERQDVLCAIEMGGRNVLTKHFGPLQPGHAEITFLDDEWSLVEGFSEVHLFLSDNGPATVYRFERVALATNLDVAGVKSVLVKSEDTA